MIRVGVPPPLRSYTGAHTAIAVEATTLGEALDALDRLYPGLRFRIVDEQGRIRPHIRFIAHGEFVTTLSYPLSADDEVQIVCALSGGMTPYRPTATGADGGPSR
jgi:sulfur-carrier protein